ncbi:hypothetical protein LOK49_LG11G01894 [Camellia lanceoleosa]|uniref:Uncharacterized protein n=1 Tax=Camellia lanceoleosa TaxID=1840588 RepID=A0ACC0G2N2_9ERIC|nr:hypothetical protein LOK49_LG11G01894 [Camellia lanceoleosa]
MSGLIEEEDPPPSLSLSLYIPPSTTLPSPPLPSTAASTVVIVGDLNRHLPLLSLPTTAEEEDLPSSLVHSRRMFTTKSRSTTAVVHHR